MPSEPKITNRFPRELFGIQSLRGMAALMVVFDHLQLYQSVYFHHVAIFPPSLVVGESGVDLFFVISGFIMMYVTPRAFAGWRDQAGFLIRRFLRIYPVYWGIAVPLVLLWLVRPNLITSFHSRDDIGSSLLLLPSHQAPIVIVAWTLIYELYFYFVASFIFYGEGRGRMVGAAVWFTIISVSTVIHPRVFASPYLNVWLSPLSLEFISGMALAEILRAGSGRLGDGWALAGLLIFAVFGFYAGMQHGRFGIDQREPVRLLVYGLPAFVVVWMVLEMEIQQRWRWIKKFAWIGDRSYSIYLLHLPILAALLRLAAERMKHPGGMEVFWITVGVIGLMAGAVEVFYRLMEKPSHALAKAVAGTLVASTRN